MVNHVGRAAQTSDSTASWYISSRTHIHLPPFHADVRLADHEDLALTVQYIKLDPHATTCPFPPTISPRDRASSDPIVHHHCRRSSIAAVVTVAAATIAALPSRWPLLPPLPPSAKRRSPIAIVTAVLAVSSQPLPPAACLPEPSNVLRDKLRCLYWQSR